VQPVHPIKGSKLGACSVLDENAALGLDPGLHRHEFIAAVSSSACLAPAVLSVNDLYTTHIM
jgi:hypothetical protein